MIDLYIHYMKFGSSLDNYMAVGGICLFLFCSTCNKILISVTVISRSTLISNWHERRQDSLIFP